LDKIQRLDIFHEVDPEGVCRFYENPNERGNYVLFSDTEALQHRAERAERAEGALRARDAEIEGLAKSWLEKYPGDHFVPKGGMAEQCSKELLALVKQH
jgi:3-methyladenine DNA glycosylase/8-oxoguanine DNA glycosylase